MYNKVKISFSIYKLGFKIIVQVLYTHIAGFIVVKLFS